MNSFDSFIRTFNIDTNQITLHCLNSASLTQREEIKSIVLPLIPYLVIGKRVELPRKDTDCVHNGTCQVDFLAFKNMLQESMEMRDILRTSDLYLSWIYYLKKE
jgi:hypothetical protein